MKLTEQKVQTLQKETKTVLKRRKFPWRVDEEHFIDGNEGPLTRKTAGFMAFCKGAPDDLVRDIHNGEWRRVTDRQFSILVGKADRPQAWIKKDKERRPTLKKLRAAHQEMLDQQSTAPGTRLVDGNPTPNWIAADIDKIRARGNWHGVVVSGFRTPEYSEHLCIVMCGAPQCPGRCAGRLTNHACPPTAKCQEFEGAVDVSDYTTFANECHAIGSKLHNSLGAQDPVHFSAAGN